MNSNSSISPGPRPLIVAGPTGVGKSRLAVRLAEELNGEIIGADAFQIYRGLPILTAQPTAELMAKVPHHLVGEWDPGLPGDAARYVAAAKECLKSIRQRGRIPLLVGGTGLYLKALTHGLADLPPVPSDLRHEVAALPLDEALWRLTKADPQAVAEIDTQNPVRVRRALEIVLSTGRPLADARSQWKSPAIDFRGILLLRDREDLHERIEANVSAMFESGVVEEVRSATGVGPGLKKAIGLDDIRLLLEGQIDAGEARTRIVFATRRYAKRQLTWFRNQFNFSYLNLTVTPDPIEAALRHLTGTNA